MVISLFACGKKDQPTDAEPTSGQTADAPTKEPTKAPDPTKAPVAGEAIPDPVYYYSFDKADGTNGIISVEKDTAASPIVQPVDGKEPIFVDGVKGDAIYADGASGYKLTEVNGVGDTYTISFWVNPSRSATYMPTVQFGPDIHGDLTGGQHYVNFTWAEWSGTQEFPCVWTYDQIGDEAVNWPYWYPDDGQTRVKVWNNLTMVVDPQNTTDEGSNIVAKFYLNGEPFGEPTIVNGTMSPSDNFEMLLGVNYWDETFKGAFDEFYVFNEVLTDGQVKTLFELGNANATYTEPEHVFEFYKEAGAIESLGADNFVSPFMSTYSKAYKIADGETWQVKLHNWSDGNDTQNNYAIVAANAAYGTDGYAEYAVVRADATGYTPAGDIPASAFNYTWGNWNTWEQKVMRDSNTTLKITRDGANLIIEASNVDYNKSANNMTATVPTTLTAADDCYFYLTTQNSWVDILSVKNATVKAGGRTVGTLDTNFWTVFTPIWSVPAGESKTISFTNYTAGGNNWENFVAILQNTPEGHANIAENPEGIDPVEGYKEYAVVRADNWGWGTAFDNADEHKSSNWNWETFTSDIDGAKIVLTATNFGDSAAIEFTATTTEGKVYTQKYTDIAVDGDVYLTLTLEKAQLVFDANIIGALDQNFWTVFSDIWAVPAGTTKEISFINTTAGENNWENFVAILQNTPEGHANIVDNPTGIAPVENYKEYAVVRADNWGWGTAFDNADEHKSSDWNWETFTSDIDGASIVLRATNYGDTAEISFTATTEEGKVYHQSYTGIAIDGDVYLTLTCEKSRLVIDSVKVGAADLSQNFWTAFSPIWKVPAGTTKTFSFTNSTAGANNWENFVAILQNTPAGHANIADNPEGIDPVEGYMEYAVLRADNWGWGNNFDNADDHKSCDWIWDSFVSDIDGAHVLVEVANDGATATVTAYVTTETNKTFTQKYTNIAVDGDIYVTFTLEKAVISFD